MARKKLRVTAKLSLATRSQKSKYWAALWSCKGISLITRKETNGTPRRWQAWAMEQLSMSTAMAWGNWARMALIFVNARAQAEFIFQELWRINEDALPIALHHGSLAAEQRQAGMAQGGGVFGGTIVSGQALLQNASRGTPACVAACMNCTCGKKVL